MSGYILLAGGAEFGGQMEQPDHRAIELAGGLAAPIRIIPTAAAPDHNHQRAGRNGISWFKRLGATQVEALPLIDTASANDIALIAEIKKARLMYLLGGFTGYLGQTLTGSLAWRAMLEAYQQGAVLAGSSAGAMVLCQYYYDPELKQVVQGLGLVANACVIPHHNTFGEAWAAQLTTLLPNVMLLGIDEQTGIIAEEKSAFEHTWHVYGKGQVTLYYNASSTAYRHSQVFKLKA